MPRKIHLNKTFQNFSAEFQWLLESNLIFLDGVKRQDTWINTFWHFYSVLGLLYPPICVLGTYT